MTRSQGYLTANGKKTLQKELDLLRDIRHPEATSRIQKALETGGTLDNAEYEESKNEQSFIEARISELETILSTSIVAKTKARLLGTVEFGSSVTVCTNTGNRKRYTVVSSAESDPLKNKISVDSPVGHALLGHKTGEKVQITTPAGISTLTILKIS